MSRDRQWVWQRILMVAFLAFLAWMWHLDRVEARERRGATCGASASGISFRTYYCPTYPSIIYRQVPSAWWK